MPLRIDKCQRLEPRARDRDLQNGFAARLHDPLWLLARQWQMGEHQGENATSPVRVNYTVSRTPINSFEGEIRRPIRRRFPPRRSSSRSGTIGGRWDVAYRAGARLEGRPEVVDAKGVRFTDPPPPYGTLVGHLDGRAVWRARERLGVPASAFGDDTPPDESAGAWDSFRLNYPGGSRAERAPSWLAITTAVRWTGIRATEIRPAQLGVPSQYSARAIPPRSNFPAPRTAAFGRSRMRRSTWRLSA